MGTITMIASGKDGVGKSTVSVFIGAALAKSGESVLVIELDSGLKCIDVISGVYGKMVYDIDDVLNGRCTPAKAIIDSPMCSGFYVMSAPFVHEKLDVPNFVRLCRALGDRYDHVIIDVAAYPESIEAAGRIADRAIIVTTADPIGVRNAKFTADAVFDRFGISNVRLLINRLVPSRVFGNIIPNLDYCIDTIGAQLIGVIPESDEIAFAAAGITTLRDDSPSGIIIRRIAKRMNGDNVPLAVE